VKKVVAVIGITVLASGAGAAGGYAAANHGDSKVRACTGTERSLAHSLATQAQGYRDNPLAGAVDLKYRQSSAAELELVRACDR